LLRQLFRQGANKCVFFLSCSCSNLRTFLTGETSRSNVDTSTEEDLGRPSTSEGNYSSFRYSTLKRAAQDVDEEPTGTSTEFVNRQATQQSDYAKGIVTYNRFACLSQDENIIEDTITQTQSQTQAHDDENIETHDSRRKRFARDPNFKSALDESKSSPHRNTTREKKPPPIYLTSKVKNYITFAKALKDSVGDNFQLKFLGEQIKIQFVKIKDFQDFKKYAIDNKFTFHTYSLPNEKTITVTLKGLPNIPNLQIQEELALHGINVNTCIKINAENSLYATFKININAEHTLTHLRKIKYLYHSKVYWDKYINSKKILQCYRCQAFGHTSANCFKNPRCVKCAQSHLTSTCTKTPDTPAKCCNCSGDHPASFTQCPVYIKFLEKRTKFTARENMNFSNISNKNLQSRNLSTQFVTRNHEIPRASSDNQYNSSNNISKNINKNIERQVNYQNSYASILNNNNNTNDDISNLNGLMNEIQKLKQLVNIPQMIMIIRNLNIKLINCRDGIEKLQAFVEAAELLDRNG